MNMMIVLSRIRILPSSDHLYHLPGRFIFSFHTYYVSGSFDHYCYFHSDRGKCKNDQKRTRKFHMKRWIGSIVILIITIPNMSHISEKVSVLMGQNEGRYLLSFVQKHCIFSWTWTTVLFQQELIWFCKKRQLGVCWHKNCKTCKISRGRNFFFPFSQTFHG